MMTTVYVADINRENVGYNYDQSYMHVWIPHEVEYIWSQMGRDFLGTEEWTGLDVGNLPDGYTRTGPLPRVNSRVNQSGLSLAKPGRAMASATWNMANQGSTWHLLQRII